MSHRCLEPEELAALADLPPEDPRRIDVAACPRCDGLLAAVAAFLEGDADLPPAESEWAQRRLAAFIRERVVPRAGQKGRRPRWGVPQSRWSFGAGFALAAAAVLAVVLLRPAAPPTPTGTVRGGGHVTGLPRIEPVSVETISGAGARGFRLDFAEVPGADSYEIILFDAALDSLGSTGPLVGPPARIGGDLLGASPGGAFARVRALQGDAAVAESQLVRLPRQ